MRTLSKVIAFIKRDFLSEVSYRLAFVMQLGGMFLLLGVPVEDEVRFVHPHDSCGLKKDSGVIPDA